MKRKAVGTFISNCQLPFSVLCFQAKTSSLIDPPNMEGETELGRAHCPLIDLSPATGTIHPLTFLHSETSYEM